MDAQGNTREASMYEAIEKPLPSQYQENLTRIEHFGWPVLKSPEVAGFTRTLRV
jgi:hypothetical protein